MKKQTAPTPVKVSGLLGGSDYLPVSSFAIRQIRVALI